MDISRNALASGFFIAGLLKQPGASALRLMGVQIVEVLANFASLPLHAWALSKSAPRGIASSSTAISSLRPTHATYPGWNGWQSCMVTCFAMLPSLRRFGPFDLVQRAHTPLPLHMLFKSRIYK